MKRSVFLLLAGLVAAPAFAQIDTVAENEEIEFLSLRLAKPNATERQNIEADRPAGPREIPVPKYIIKSTDSRFLMTIGGKINPILGWDLGNNLYEHSGIDFTPQDIPVPALPHHKSDFFINALKADIDFQIVGFAGTPSQVTGYIKLSSNGSDPHIKINKAYVTWRGITFGLNNTLMKDADACQTATIDPQGPAGEVSGNAYQLSYKSKEKNGWQFAAGIDIPTYYSSNGVYRGHDYPDFAGTQVANLFANTEQLVPDIPAWIQYRFSEGNRVRLSAILRNFAYQDLVKDKTRYTQGWGVMLSGTLSPSKFMTFSYQAAYGNGIGAYIQDISGMPLSFVPSDSDPGKMSASPMMGVDLGLTFNVSPRWQVNVFGSEARIWDVRDYATVQADKCNYKYGLYGGANVFYKITSYLQWGMEYLYGRHQTWNAGSACDSRIQTQLIFTL